MESAYAGGMTRQLKAWAQAEADDFYMRYRDRGCSCHISPPCSSCTHPGNPLNLAETDDAWGFDIDYEVEAAKRRLLAHVERESNRHLAELKARAALESKHA